LFPDFRRAFIDDICPLLLTPFRKKRKEGEREKGEQTGSGPSGGPSWRQVEGLGESTSLRKKKERRKKEEGKGKRGREGPRPTSDGHEKTACDISIVFFSKEKKRKGGKGKTQTRETERQDATGVLVVVLVAYVILTSVDCGRGGKEGKKEEGKKGKKKKKGKNKGAHRKHVAPRLLSLIRITST